MKRILRALACALLVAACAGDDDDDDLSPATVSCRVESAGDAVQCLEYTVPPEAVAATRDGCTAGGGTLVAACPKENRLGTCTTSLGGALTIVTHYYTGGLTPETAEELCKGSGGSYEPG